jgi:hypothetical protein
MPQCVQCEQLVGRPGSAEHLNSANHIRLAHEKLITRRAERAEHELRAARARRTEHAQSAASAAELGSRSPGEYGASFPHSASSLLEDESFTCPDGDMYVGVGELGGVTHDVLPSEAPDERDDEAARGVLDEEQACGIQDDMAARGVLDDEEALKRLLNSSSFVAGDFEQRFVKDTDLEPIPFKEVQSVHASVFVEASSEGHTPATDSPQAPPTRNGPWQKYRNSPCVPTLLAQLENPSQRDDALHRILEACHKENPETIPPSVAVLRTLMADVQRVLGVDTLKLFTYTSVVQDHAAPSAYVRVAELIQLVLRRVDISDAAFSSTYDDSHPITEPSDCFNWSMWDHIFRHWTVKGYRVLRIDWYSDEVIVVDYKLKFTILFISFPGFPKSARMRFPVAVLTTRLGTGDGDAARVNLDELIHYCALQDMLAFEQGMLQFDMLDHGVLKRFKFIGPACNGIHGDSVATKLVTNFMGALSGYGSSLSHIHRTQYGLGEDGYDYNDHRRQPRNELPKIDEASGGIPRMGLCADGRKIDYVHLLVLLKYTRPNVRQNPDRGTFGPRMSFNRFPLTAKMLDIIIKVDYSHCIFHGVAKRLLDMLVARYWNEPVGNHRGCEVFGDSVGASLRALRHLGLKQVPSFIKGASREQNKSSFAANVAGLTFEQTLHVLCVIEPALLLVLGLPPRNPFRLAIPVFLDLVEAGAKTSLTKQEYSLIGVRARQFSRVLPQVVTEANKAPHIKEYVRTWEEKRKVTADLKAKAQARADKKRRGKKTKQARADKKRRGKKKTKRGRKRQNNGKQDQQRIANQRKGWTSGDSSRDTYDSSSSSGDDGSGGVTVATSGQKRSIEELTVAEEDGQQLDACVLQDVDFTQLSAIFTPAAPPVQRRRVRQHVETHTVNATSSAGSSSAASSSDAVPIHGPDFIDEVAQGLRWVVPENRILGKPWFHLAWPNHLVLAWCVSSLSLPQRCAANSFFPHPGTGL